MRRTAKSVNRDLETFEFEIAVGPDTGLYAEGAFVVFVGTLTHFNSSTLRLDQGQVAPLRVGFRLLTKDTNTVLYEGRAILDTQMLQPKLPYPFKLIIPSESISQSQMVLIVDFLYEGEFWFHESTHRLPNRFPVEPIKPVAPVRSESLTSDPSSPLALVLEALMEYDFSNYSSLLAMGRARHEDVILDQKVKEKISSCGDGTDVMPLTEFMRHYALLRRSRTARSPTNRAGRFELLREIFPLLASIGGESGSLVPPSSIDYLTAIPLADGMFDIPMTRIMLWYWLNEGKTLQPEMRLDRANVYWWWATAVMPGAHVPTDLLGTEVLSYFSGVHEEFRGRPIRLTTFYFKAYQESKPLTNRYDLQSDKALIAYSFDSLITHLTNPINQLFFGASVLGFWRQLISANADDPNLFEMALALAVDRSENRLRNASVGTRGKIIREILTARSQSACQAWLGMYTGATRELLLDRLARSARTEKAQQLANQRVTIVGLLASPSGLGVNARMSKAVFENMGLDVEMVDLRAPSERPMQHRGAALYHINADAVPMAILEGGGKRIRADQRIGFFLWELDKIPEIQRLGIDLVDEIWVPTEFLREVYSEVARVPVRNVGKYLLTPDISRLARPKNEAFTFLVSFDYHSGVERKNPLIALQAFCKAFPPSARHVAIVIKTTEFVPHHWGDPHDQWVQIMEIAQRDSRVRVVSDMLSEADYFSLINDCDCVVSTHRAEGFGYLPAYAMLLGKSVVTTNYSGTTDFCNSDTSWLLKYRLKPVLPGEFMFDVPGAVWADVDLDQLVETMREVIQADGLRIKREQAGQNFVREHYSLDAQSERYKESMRGFGYSFRQ
jgi:glycosyltransferase involved in cell wall biosynthesis